MRLVSRFALHIGLVCVLIYSPASSAQQLSTPPKLTRRRRRKFGPTMRVPRFPPASTCCAAPTVHFAPTTICSTTTSTSASIPEKKSIAGKNTIRFRMLQGRHPHPARSARRAEHRQDPPRRYAAQVSSATRGAVFVDFPRDPASGPTCIPSTSTTPAHPRRRAASAAFTFKKDPAGRTWINTACEETGASIWWPNKDQWRDEVESMDISVAIPNGLDRRLQRPASSARQISATATRAGTGTSAIRSTTTTSR